MSTGYDFAKNRWEYRELLGEIQQTRDALKRELVAALGGSREGAKARR